MAANGSFCSNSEKRGIKVEARGTSPHWLSRNGGVGTMAMPQRDDRGILEQIQLALKRGTRVRKRETRKAMTRSF